MGVDWGHEASEQLAWHWKHQVRPGLEGLTDDEYFWEPVPGCWSIRPRREARSSMAAGGGDLVADWEFPEPAPPPVTTIAWRLGHLLVGVFGVRNAAQFGAPPIDYQTVEWSPDAASALARLDTAYDTWMEGLGGLGEDGWSRPIGPSEGPRAEVPLGGLALHINREAIHHAAEILLLRALYRNRP